MSDDTTDFTEGLNEILSDSLERWKQNVERPLRDLMEERVLTWKELAEIITLAIPRLAGSFSPTSMQARVAADFLARFADHATAQGTGPYDGTELTIRGSSLFDLFRYQFALLETSAEKLESKPGEKKRVSNNLGVILNGLRKKRYADVEHAGRVYIVAISIPDVKLGRGSNAYSVSLFLTQFQLGDSLSPLIMDAERNGFFEMLEEHWENGAMDWRNVGFDLENWLHHVRETHPLARIVKVLNGMTSHLDLDTMIYFVNAMTGFQVDPFRVDPMTLDADYIGEAWQQCMSATPCPDEAAARVAEKIKSHVGFSTLEKAMALRILRIWGAKPFDFMYSLRGPNSRAHVAADMGTAQNIYNVRMVMNDILTDAQAWLDAEAAKEA
jgi:hypothetical protein